MSEVERATPYNRPMPQWSPPAPQDPTAAPLAEGGSLKLNPYDRAALTAWFGESFLHQLRDDSWFCRDWLPDFMAPIYKTLNANFKELIGRIGKSNEDVLQLREEVLIEVAKARKEMAADIVKARADMRQDQINWIGTKDREFKAEVAKMRRLQIEKCNSDLNIMRDDLLRVLRRDMADEVRKVDANWIKNQNAKASADTKEVVQTIEAAVEIALTEMVTTYNVDIKSMRAEILDTLRKELAQEIIKMAEKS
jgi:dGTP triphosphohydrolase